MRINTTPAGTAAEWTLYKEQAAIGRAVVGPAGAISGFWIAPRWRRRGYGSYFIKEILRAGGAYAPGAESFFTAPLPADAGALAFAARFGFAAENGFLCRRRLPDLSAVSLVHRALAGLVRPGGFLVRPDRGAVEEGHAEPDTRLLRPG